MRYRIALLSLSLVAMLSGCGGGSSSSSSSSSSGSTTGGLVSTSGTVTTTPRTAAFGTTAGRAYSVELKPTAYDPDLIVTDHVYSNTEPYWGSLYEMSSNSAGKLDVVSFIAATSATHYSYVYTFDASASYSLQIYSNQLTANGASLSRKTLNSPVYFSFEAVAGQAYNVTVTPSSSDASLSVYSGAPGTATLIGTSNNNVGTQAESLIFVATESKTYYAKVSNVDTATELNFATKLQTTTEAADLQVSINSLAYSSGSLTVNYTVSNTGVAYSSAANLHFWLDSATAPTEGLTGDSQVLIAGVAPGGTVSGSKTINVAALTHGTFWAYIDPENVLAEADETNNASVGRPWSAPVAAPQSYNFESGVAPTALTFSGNADWGVVAGGAGASAYSFRSGTVDLNQTSCTEIAVTGAARVSFDWKALADYSTDYLKFYVDGYVQTTYSGADTWVNYVYNTYSTSLHTFKWCYLKGPSDNPAVDDGAWIDNIVLQPELPDLTVTINSVSSDGSNLTVSYTVANNSTAASAASVLDLWADAAAAPTVGATGDVQVNIPVIAGNGSYANSATVPSIASNGVAYAIIDSQNAISEKTETNNVSGGKSWQYLGVPLASHDFEDGLLPATFVASGNAGWQVDATTASSGIYSIRAQTITHSQNSCIALTVPNSSAITFDWKVSSESCCDDLSFSIDGAAQAAAISGTVNWIGKEFTGLAVATHEYKWCYAKDSSVSSGTDTGWIDNIVVY